MSTPTPRLIVPFVAMLFASLSLIVFSSSRLLAQSEAADQSVSTSDALTSFTDAARPRTQYFPNTSDGIHLEMVFNYNLANPQSEEGKVDMVWGSNFADQPKGVYNTSYIPYSVDNFTNSVAWYQANHPDWLEYLCDRKTLAFEFGSTSLAPLNFASEEVRGYQWAQWVDAPLAQGFPGIAVDTMDLTNDWARCGHFGHDGEWVQQYSGKLNDASFRRDVLSWEAATYAHIHQFSNTATMQVNVSYQFGEPVEDNLRLMSTTDLLFDERGFTNWGGPPNVPTPAQWETIVGALHYVESKGLCYMTNGEEPVSTNKITRADQLWVLANYLLVKNECTYVYMTGITDGAQDYGSLVLFPTYSIPIGHPICEMRKIHDVWERLFSGGLTLVNPYNRMATVDIPADKYIDLNGKPVGPAITMPPQTGQILLLSR